MERRGNEGNLITVNLKGSDDSKLPALSQGDVVEVVDGDNDHDVKYTCKVFSPVPAGRRVFESDEVEIHHSGDNSRKESYAGIRSLQIKPEQIFINGVRYRGYANLEAI